MRNTDDSGKTSCKRAVERLRRGEVAAERLFDDDARVVGASGVRQTLHHGAEHARRNRQIMQRARRASERLLQARRRWRIVSSRRRRTAAAQHSLAKRRRHRHRHCPRRSLAHARAACPASNRARAMPMIGISSRPAGSAPAARGRSSCRLGRRSHRRKQRRWTWASPFLVLRFWSEHRTTWAGFPSADGDSNN